MSAAHALDKAQFLAIEYGPGHISSDPERGLAIFPCIDALHTLVGRIPKDYEFCVVSLDQLESLRSKVIRRKCLLLDGGNQSWRYTITELVKSVGGHVEYLVPELVPLNIKKLLALEVPPRELILSPWLPTQGLAMIYAVRGIGKTLIALWLAYTVATGGTFLKWKADRPRRVLYLDGEMPLVSMQGRMARIVRETSDEPPDPDYFRLISPDMQEQGFNLAIDEGRRRLEPLLEGIDLVIVDNISTLASFGRENESESWLPLQEWALSLRRRCISVLFIHHAGKGGAQRGTSRREDVLDTVIALRHPKNYDPRTGAHFEVHFEKARGLIGEDAAAFDAKLTPQGWAFQDLENVRNDQVQALKAEGLTQREIATELDISAATVNRILKQPRQASQKGGTA